MKYAREVLGVLNSDFHADMRKLAQKATTIREKMQKGQGMIKISTQDTFNFDPSTVLQTFIAK